MDKQKQIEEMEKVIFERGVALESIDFIDGTEGSDHFKRIAIALYNAGYRKIPENAVVLTREEFETLKNGHKPLQKLIEELRVRNDFLESEYSSQFWDGVKEGKNKTIIGFQEMFLAEYGAFEDGDKITLLELRRHFDEIAKEITEGEGIEIYKQGFKEGVEALKIQAKERKFEIVTDAGNREDVVFVEDIDEIVKELCE